MAHAKTKKEQGGRASPVGGALMGLSAMAALGAAAAYFLYGGKGAKRRRAKVRGWMLKAKGEVLEKLERAKEINREVAHAIIEQVTAKYAKVKDVGEEEARRLGEELKRRWEELERDLARSLKQKSKKRASRKAPAKRGGRARKSAADKEA